MFEEIDWPGGDDEGSGPKKEAMEPAPYRFTSNCGCNTDTIAGFNIARARSKRVR